MLVARYKTKQELKSSIGKTLRYEEIGLFGGEFSHTGTFSVVSPKTHSPKWYAEVLMEGGYIKKVT